MRNQKCAIRTLIELADKCAAVVDGVEYSDLVDAVSSHEHQDLDNEIQEYVKVLNGDIDENAESDEYNELLHVIFCIMSTGN